MKTFFARSCLLAVAAASVAMLAACGSSPRTPAPVEDRATPRPAVAMPESKPLPGAENAGKPGYYTVQKGDTLTHIGLNQGQAWRDLARWNNLNNPHVIEVGQVLRVAPPGAAVEAHGVVVHPIASPANGPATPAKAPATAPQTSAAAGEEISLAWPANGQVVQGFDESKNKGIDIGGKAGDPVLAAADGQVVYAGAGLRGYGNLVILKHNNTYLTAYAHNQKLLVKEDQKVRRGDRIAEMGSSDADRVKLHFEVRRQGKPVDPAKFLAAR
ncbi:MAG: LysM peptidoglycan-binding domain-containing protein [Betaproteobacteria bacterium]|nr:LysM peptidoglycan-binding domain-containing protein [Betaproteobacteria bacterium]